MLAPSGDGAYGDVRTTALVLVAAAAALAATGLVHLLIVNTPRPFLFFGWIVALVTTLVVVYPFSTTAPLDAKIATAVVNLAIGAMIGTLVGGAAARSTVNATRRAEIGAAALVRWYPARIAASGAGLPQGDRDDERPARLGRQEQSLSQAQVTAALGFDDKPAEQGNEHGSHDCTAVATQDQRPRRRAPGDEGRRQRERDRAERSPGEVLRS